MSYDQMRALRHYSEQAKMAAAQARFDALAAPESSEDDEAFDDLQTAVELAQSHLRSALSALARRDMAAAQEYVSNAVAEVGGVL